MSSGAGEYGDQPSAVTAFVVTYREGVVMLGTNRSCF